MKKFLSLLPLLAVIFTLNSATKAAPTKHQISGATEVPMQGKGGKPAPAPTPTPKPRIGPPKSNDE